MISILKSRICDGPVNVECWFCQKNNLVDRSNRNKFICSECQQYNGFKSNGDYNCDITKLSTGNKSFVEKVQSKPTESFLCQNCDQNERIKLDLIACYEPSDTLNWRSDYDLFKESIEKKYPLCNACHRKSLTQISRINGKVFQSRINNFVPPNRQSKRFLINNGSFNLSVKILSLINLLSLCTFFGPMVQKTISAILCRPWILSREKQTLLKVLNKLYPLRDHAKYCPNILGFNERVQETHSMFYSHIFGVALLTTILRFIQSYFQRNILRKPFNILFNCLMLISLFYSYNRGHGYLSKLSVLVSGSILTLICVDASLPYFLRDFKQQKKAVSSTWPTKENHLKSSWPRSSLYKRNIDRILDASDNQDIDLASNFSQLSTSDDATSTSDTMSLLSMSNNSVWSMGSERRRRREKHRGLFRAIIYLLFGKIDSWRALKKNLICLVNTNLLFLILYLGGKLFYELFVNLY